MFSSKRKLEEYIAKKTKEDQKVLYFKLTGKLKVKEISSELLDYIAVIISDRGKQQHTADLIINEAINTCRIRII